MTLPLSGPISLSDVNTELGLSTTAQISMNDAAVRTLFGAASGAISMSDGYGKANDFTFTIGSNQTNANLRTLAINAGWNGIIKVVATISSGIYISSDSTATPALTVNGSFPGGVELINNGFIVARGGAGGTGGIYVSGGTLSANTRTGSAGGAGGLALSVSSAITINNIGTIGGGGGGGGGGGAGSSAGFDQAAISTGSGGGGGRSSQTNSTGGARGTSTVSGDTVTLGVVGSAGTAAAAAAATDRPVTATGAGISARGGAGGAGGNWGSVGSAGGTSSASGADQTNTRTGGAGGAAGGAITGNSNITYIAIGTRLGAIT